MGSVSEAWPAIGAGRYGVNRLGMRVFAPAAPRSRGTACGMSDASASAREGAAWRGFCRLFAATCLGLGLGAVGFMAVCDPYGLRAAPGRAPGPLMDSNQRFLYPQIVRGGRYDSVVIGTSTARLLDPADLDRALGGRFANLAMNAATPFEQVRMARLVLAQGASSRSVLRTLVLGLDSTWCEARADARRFTFRPFPAWLYEPGTPGGLWRQVNWQGLVTASRVVLHGLGRMPERIRGDGYAVFTPPDAQYDAARAAAHIHGGTSPLAEADAVEGTDAPSAPMPALIWLDALLADLPPGARTHLAFMPVHAAAQGRPGTRRGAREAACKARVAEIGRRHGVEVLDFRIASPVTTQDANYWDALHYRLPVAARIVEALASAPATDDPAGFYRVLARP